MARRPRASTVTIIALVAVVLVSLTGYGYGPDPSTSRVAISGPAQLQLAADSLRTGAGPAAGVPLACAGDPSTSDTCTAASANPSVSVHYQWSNLSTQVASVPSARATMMTWDAADGYVLLFGGLNPVGAGPLTDTWTYLNGTWTNITGQVTGTPPALFSGSMAYDPSASDVVLFGGITGSGVYRAYTYTYHARGWANLTAASSSAPSPRAFAAFAWDAEDSEMVLFGGRVSAVSWVADTWIFNDPVWTNVTSSQPFALPPIYSPVLAQYAGSGALLFGGGQWGGGTHSATYVFAQGTWTNDTSTAGTEPPAFYYGAAVYLPVFQGDLVFGTYYRSASNLLLLGASTWLFSGGSWSNLTSMVTPNGIFPDWSVAAAHTPYDQAIVTFGGFGPVIASPFMWAFATLPSVTALASARTTDVGINVTFTGTIAGGLFPTTAAWSLGDGTSASALTVTHAYSSTGIFQANFTGTSFTGAAAAQSTLLLVNPAPSATLTTVPAAPSAGSAVGFVPSASGGTTPYTYAWAFGDGATSALNAPVHAYDKAGVYLVTLNVTDSAGAVAHAEGRVTVGASLSSSPSPSGSSNDLYYLAGLGVLAAAVIALAVLLVRARRRPPEQKPPA